MKYLAFDIETARTDMPDGDDLMDHLQTLGISCAATLTSGGALKLWHGSDSMTSQQCRSLVKYLWEAHFIRGHTIVGFNAASFDFRVLATESGMLETCKRLALNHVDFGFHFFCEKGFMPSLQNIALGMGLKGKSGKGADAPRLWAEGKRKAVLAYVEQDVRVTMSVFQEIQKRGCVEWLTKRGRVRTWIPGSGELLPVRKAMKLPEPDVSWMDNYWGRDKFVGWLK